ncbi:BMP family lipoprotein [Halorarius halobius]|uniref:BMP family lipoprotein n=1 Tax=Halorarius halobius TaxID=2962671 RepID=UPI0020CFC12E|nr:BMP family protein [Halorarius halobius]
MPLDRRRFVTATGIAGLAGLAGCTGGPSSDDGSPTDTDGGGDDETTDTDDGGDSMETAAHIGMVYATGGLGDGSFNDQAQQGVQAAEEELNVQYQSAQPEEVSEFGTFQQQFAQSQDPDYDLVSCIGFLQADALSETAPQYPDQHFQIVDSVPMKDTDDDGEGDEQFDNVASYVFAEEEGSYLVGQLAGLLTTRSFSAGAGSTQSDSTNVGFVGGVESGLIKKFEAGYTAGVKAADGDVDVQTAYVGSFNDPGAGREAALSMYNSGADVVYHASGNTGTGVFRAAQDQGRFAIGVDRDQSVTKSSFKNVILASMVKRVDTAVYNAIEAEVNGEFEGGTTTALGLDDDGVAAVYGQQLGSEIPSSVKDEIASSRQSIIDGDIDVPTDPENV